MGKIRKNKRRVTPAKVVKKHFEAALLQLSSDFLKSDSFKHALSKGEEREKPLSEFFLRYLPKIYGICSGEVVDLFDKSSPQMDLMIYDQFRNFGFNLGSKSILPAEALLVSIEIKSRLNANELRKSLKASIKLHDLKPFKESLSHARLGGESVDGKCRYFHCIFAYDTDLANTSDWIQKEYKRYDKIAKELNCPIGHIERIYIAKRGLLNPRKNWGLRENQEGSAFMHFYLDIYNYIDKENKRRNSTPYIAYIGQIGKTKWEELE